MSSLQEHVLEEQRQLDSSLYDLLELVNTMRLHLEQANSARRKAEDELNHCLTQLNKLEQSTAAAAAAANDAKIHSAVEGNRAAELICTRCQRQECMLGHEAIFAFAGGESSSAAADADLSHLHGEGKPPFQSLPPSESLSRPRAGTPPPSAKRQGIPVPAAPDHVDPPRRLPVCRLATWGQLREEKEARNRRNSRERVPTPVRTRGRSDRCATAWGPTLRGAPPFAPTFGHLSMGKQVEQGTERVASRDLLIDTLERSPKSQPAAQSSAVARQSSPSLSARATRSLRDSRDHCRSPSSLALERLAYQNIIRGVSPNRLRGSPF
eukprot:NODE_2450_length_1198_cov_27.092254_g2235_i0.p1 GENE.NODE_2450_length_1198_cov_27.092254_g2235_i0~~NODE_2450_length_1198_cov_27.092254_g2235_i0.p1  ORF type:complete len:324 (-),score=45.26 NODE_2450_length_1198_cov_27.092254_g2235_i0:102-1073(-)